MHMIPIIGMPAYRDISPHVVLSLLSTTSLLRKKDIHYGVSMPYGESVVSVARNRCVDQFLEMDGTHLFWIDSDIVWEAKDFLRVLELGQKYPVVGATYVTKTDPPGFLLDVEGEGEDGCLAVGGMGLGFTCVQRVVIEELASTASEAIVLDPKLQEVTLKKVIHDEERGEDKNFFLDVKALGIQPMLVPDITLGHVGTKIYRGNFAEVLNHERDQRIRHADLSIWTDPGG